MKLEHEMRELRNLLSGSVDSETKRRLQMAWGLRYSDEAAEEALKRQRDELHETANRYLESKRFYAAKAEYWQREHAALLAEAEQAKAMIDDFAAKVDAGEYLVYNVNVKTPGNERSYLVAPLKRLLWLPAFAALALFVGIVARVAWNSFQ